MDQSPPSNSISTQMRSLKEEFDSMQEVKDVELARLERELREAHEEIHGLHLDAEEAAAVHENEIAGLQEELCRLKAELERAQGVRHEYDMELTALRAEIEMKKGADTGDRQPSLESLAAAPSEDELCEASEEVARLQEELRTLRAQYQDLSDEYQILQESNKIMVHQLERLEAIKYNESPPDRSRSKSEESPFVDTDSEGSTERTYRRFSIGRRNTLRSGSSVTFKSVEVVGLASEVEEDGRMEKLEEESEHELQYQLRAEEEKVERVQAQCEQTPGSLHELESVSSPGPSEWGAGPEAIKMPDSAARGRERRDSECDQAQHRLREMESKYQLSQAEWEQLHEDLRLCKEEIERLNGTIPVGGRVAHAPDPPVISLPVIGLVVIVALLWCWWSETSS